MVALLARKPPRHLGLRHTTEVVDEPLFNAMYIELGALGRMLGEPETYSGANLTIDTATTSIDLRRAAISNFRQTSDEIVRFVRQIEIVFAIIIAFGMVYNTARISLAERGRELATLRVLGFTRCEVSAILLGEVAALAAPAIPLGSVTGYLLSGLVMRTMSGKSMHVALVVEPASYAYGRARIVEVEIGPSDGTWTAVTNGLGVGATVITQPSDTIEDGTHIAPRVRTHGDVARGPGP